MNLYVKHKKVDHYESNWFMAVDGQLQEAEDFQLGFDGYFKSDQALRYEILENEGSLYLRCMKQEAEEEQEVTYEYELFLMFEEEEKEEIVHLVQKFLMDETAFWTAFQGSFQVDADQNSFHFHYLELADCEIRLPQIGINKEYSLPMVLKDTNQKARELLASNLEYMDTVSIITQDTIEGVKDLNFTIFITGHLEQLKGEIKGMKAKRTLLFTTKLIAVTVSIVGVVMIALRFIKKLSKKNE